MSHACTLRCLGQRLLKIRFRMISEKTSCDAEFHGNNQLRANPDAFWRIYFRVMMDKWSPPVLPASNAAHKLHPCK
jgi:hypothetical protein